MRRVVLLAGGVVLAGAGLLVSTGAGPTTPPKAAIEGAPLESKPPPQEVAAFEALAEKKAAPAQIDLDRIELVGDHYEARLPDGRRARLTLDPDLQAAAEKLLAEARAPRGAIVAMTPDGKILALAGRRTAEPKGGTKGTNDWHLATDAWAPAASVFKLVTASALVAGGVDPDAKVCYHGGLHKPVESQIRDDRRDNDCQSLAYGVAHSNNSIVGKVAFQHLEPGALVAAAHDLGLAGAVIDELPATFAQLALPETKDLALAQAAAGFSDTKLSALGGALLASTFADDGTQPTPRIIDSLDGAPRAAPPARRAIPEAVAREVGKMMVQTCEVGSAAKSFGRHRKVKVAGKTGTLTTTEPFEMENSWFVGFAPADKPEIVVSVVLGNAENWHLRGHEAARRLIDRAIRHGRDHDDDPRVR